MRRLISGGISNLATADVVVSGGKRLRNIDNYNKLVNDLSLTLGKNFIAGLSVELQGQP